MKSSFHHILCFTLLFFLSATSSVFAGDMIAPSVKPLEPRVDFGFRPGNERTIGVTQFWVPLLQDIYHGEVFYGDFRVMDDSQDNLEFNAGLGYRQSFNDYILGIHGWYDRRLTQSGSKFNQITVGGEYFSNDWDGKINAYFPLNKQETFTRANPNGAGTGFAGNQVIVNTDQTVREEALTGFDVEIGRRLPFMDTYTDSTRAYLAGFHFQGDRADSVSGWRTRFSSDINPNIQIGARFQRDNVRGSQGFLEATFRLPFGRKNSYKDHGLWARMDESPERDIDIVSNEAVLGNGIGAVLFNQDTDTPQNIIHVDNSAGAGGTGTNEARFDTLADAEAAAGANDIIYIHTGLGTTFNQDTGITLDDTGQMLIGAGSGLSFDGTRFGTSNGANINGAATTIIAPTTAPIITNTGGHGINITADDVVVSGLTVNGATGRSVNISNANGTMIQNTTSEGSVSTGIYGRFNDDRSYNLLIDTLSVSNSGGSGIIIDVLNATRLDAKIQNNTVDMNGNNGISTVITDTAYGDIVYQNNILSNNNGVNLRFSTNDDATGRVTILNNQSKGNDRFMGILVRAAYNGIIQDAVIENNLVQNSNTDGITLDLLSSVNSTIENAVIGNNTLINNTRNGINILGTEGNGNINVKILDNRIIGNSEHGLRMNAMENTDIVALVQGNLITDSMENGIRIIDDSTGSIVADLGGGALGSGGQNAIYNNISNNAVDIDGDLLKAENNWWGAATGLKPSDINLIDGSTVDASPFLTQRP